MRRFIDLITEASYISRWNDHDMELVVSVRGMRITALRNTLTNLTRDGVMFQESNVGLMTTEFTIRGRHEVIERLEEMLTQPGVKIIRSGGVG